MLSAALAHGLSMALMIELSKRVGMSFGWSAFGMALHSAVQYAGLAFALSRKAREAGLTALALYAALGIPSAVLALTSPAPTAVLYIYLASTWGACALIGWRLSGLRWKGGLAALTGNAAGYGVHRAVLALAPSLTLASNRPSIFLPPATLLLDGLLTGAGVGLGISLLRRHHEKASRA
jgi:hypothetical protein